MRYIYIYHASEGWGKGVGSIERAWKKTCFYVFLFTIAISIGPFSSSPIINKVFQVLFPVYISLVRIIRRIPSHLTLLKGSTCPCRLALSYSRRWSSDWLRWMATPQNCVGCSRILKGTACHSALLRDAGAYSRKMRQWNAVRYKSQAIFMNY